MRIAVKETRRAMVWTAAALGALLPLDDATCQAIGYLDFGALTDEVRDLVAGSDLARVRSLGASHEDREVWLVEIGDPGGPALSERPGLLIVANLEGDHLLGSSLALETIRNILARAREPDVAEVLQRHVIYVVPRLNPDGAERMFAAVESANGKNARSYDDDNDGRFDEDPPEDLNGDGVITVMRVPSATGAYLPRPDEPRLMKTADPSFGESGSYAVYWEGTDNDGDGFYNEDGAGGVDLNRNFQHAYPYWQRDAGPHMVSEPESRALIDFVIAHRNIAAMLTFGHSDNLVIPPDARGALAAAHTLDLPSYARASLDEVFTTGVFQPRRGGGFGFGFGGGGSSLRGAQPGRDNDPNSGRRPATMIHEADRQYFERVSDAYKEITGITRVGVNREPEGAFFQYGYFQFGVPSFSTQGWGLPEAADTSAGVPEGAPGPRTRGPRGVAEDSTDVIVLAALEGAGIHAFVEWTPFQHPDLGAVEIGGFRPSMVTNPPANELTELGRRHAEFAVRLAGMLPRVRIAETSVIAHGGGVFTVTVEVENAGYFPTSLQHGVVSRSVAPTTVQIQVPPEDVLTGDDKTSTIEKLDGSGRRERFSWVIRGRPGATVQIRMLSQKGGTDTVTVTLRSSP